MRRHKRKRALDDSFELFLDTITNTFGGVLLIALLIVLMIRESKDSAPETAKSGPTENMEVIQSQIASLEAAKTQLEIDLKTVQHFQENFQNDDLKLLAKKMLQLTSRNNELQIKLESLERETTIVARQTKGAETDIQRLSIKLASKISERNRLAEELAKEKKLRTTTMKLPKEASTAKREIAVVVEQNQLFFVNSDRSGFGFSLNKQHFEDCSASDASVDLSMNSKHIRAKIGAGISIRKQEIKKEFNKFRSSDSFFTFVVRPDSFDAFAVIRDESVRSGFEYRIIPTDGMVSEAAGTNAKAQ